MMKSKYISMDIFISLLKVQDINISFYIHRSPLMIAKAVISLEIYPKQDFCL